MAADLDKEFEHGLDVIDEIYGPGVRENMAVERAERKLAQAGAPAGALDVLVKRRLLTYEERLGTQRVELMHIFERMA